MCTKKNYKKQKKKIKQHTSTENPRQFPRKITPIDTQTIVQKKKVWPNVQNITQQNTPYKLWNQNKKHKTQQKPKRKQKRKKKLFFSTKIDTWLVYRGTKQTHTQTHTVLRCLWVFCFFCVCVCVCVCMCFVFFV